MLSDLEKYRNYAIDAANDLGYGEDVIDQLISAKTETKITNIMTFAREKLGKNDIPVRRTRSLKRSAKYISRRRKAVEKVDMQGNVVETYETVTDAAEQNNLSRTQLIARCRNEVKQPYAFSNYTFRYKQNS